MVVVVWWACDVETLLEHVSNFDSVLSSVVVVGFGGGGGSQDQEPTHTKTTQKFGGIRKQVPDGVIKLPPL